MTKKQKKELRQILAAGVLYALILVLEHTGACPFLFERWYLALIIYLVPYLIVGWSVLRKAALGMKNRQVFDESFLMTIATIGAFATRENSEAVAVMLFYQVGEFFQGYAVGKSRQSIRDLMDIAPEHANVLQEDGSVETVDPDDVEIDDILVIRPGEKVPVDGIVTEGSGMVNTAALTGESVPRSVRPGSDLISGCINGENLLHMRATKVYDDSTVARILELVETASEKKSRTENFITRFARYYTPVVVIGALILALVPPLFLGNWSDWIIRACTFLVISCPCALVISVPLAFFGGIGAASKAGVLVKGSNYLELLAQLDTVVTDKTGTLTKGQFEVLEIRPARSPAELLSDGPQNRGRNDPSSESGYGDTVASTPGHTDRSASGMELLRLAALAESASTHPIARSICEAWKTKLPALRPESAEKLLQTQTAGHLASDESVSGQTSDDKLIRAEDIPGQGVVANLQTAEGSITVCAGSARLLSSHGIGIPDSASGNADSPGNPSANTTVYVAKDAQYLGAILIGDEIKPDAAEALTAMKHTGVRELVMLTGDHAEVGQAVADSLGIDTVFAELLPQDKVAKVEELLAALSSPGAGSNRPEISGAGAAASSSGTNRRVSGKLAFIGDGVNDAPVLSRADIGIAMGSMGSDAAIEAADVVIMDDNLARIPIVMQIARRTVGISKQNIVFALTVKAIILVLGALGLAGMWAAVFADVGVAVLCILNSMRLLRA